jgi:hypothetical protein
VSVHEVTQSLTPAPLWEKQPLAGALGYTLKAEYNMGASSSSGT